MEYKSRTYEALFTGLIMPSTQYYSVRGSPIPPATNRADDLSQQSTTLPPSFLDEQQVMYHSLAGLDELVKRGRLGDSLSDVFSHVLRSHDAGQASTPLTPHDVSSAAGTTEHSLLKRPMTSAPLGQPQTKRSREIGTADYYQVAIPLPRPQDRDHVLPERFLLDFTAGVTAASPSSQHGNAPLFAQPAGQLRQLPASEQFKARVESSGLTKDRLGIFWSRNTLALEGLRDALTSNLSNTRRSYERAMASGKYEYAVALKTKLNADYATREGVYARLTNVPPVTQRRMRRRSSTSYKARQLQEVLRVLHLPEISAQLAKFGVPRNLPRKMHKMT